MQKFPLFGFSIIAAHSPVPGLLNGEIFCNLETVSDGSGGSSDVPVDFASFLGPNVIGRTSGDDFSTLAAKFSARTTPLTNVFAHSLTPPIEVSGLLGTATVSITNNLFQIKVRNDDIVTEEIEAGLNSATIKYGTTEIEFVKFGSSDSWVFSVSQNSPETKTIVWENGSYNLIPNTKLEFDYSENNLSVGDELMTSLSASVQFFLEEITIAINQNLVIVSWKNRSYWISMSEGVIGGFVDDSGPYWIGAEFEQQVGLAAALVRANLITSLSDGASKKLLTAYSLGAAKSGPLCKPEFPRYQELMLIEFGGNVVAANRPSETCLRVCRMRGGYPGGSCGCLIGRLEGDSSPVCSVRESNSFAVTSIYSLLVESCLTPGSLQDNQSNVIECVINTLPAVGITLLDGLCFECLIDFIDTQINRAPRNVRAACTADPFGPECLAGVDFSTLALCSNGYDPRYPEMMSYCSEFETKGFIETAVYRTISDTCLNDLPNLSSCIEKVEADLKGITPECFSCWSDLFDAFMDMAICESDENESCFMNLSKAVGRFRTCAGFDPLEMDRVMKTHSQDTITRSNVTESVIPTIVTILMISMILLH
jgi:hypothetical protein